MYSNVLYGTIMEVKSVSRVATLIVQGREKWMNIPDAGYPIALDTMPYWSRCP